MTYNKKFFQLFIWLGLAAGIAEGGEVLNGEKYMEDIGRRFVAEIESHHTSGYAMPMMDFTNTINKKLYQKTAKGKVKFHSGFVNRIESANLEMKTFKTALDAEYVILLVDLELKNVQIFYDIEMDLEEHKGNGGIIMNFPSILFSLQVKHVFETNNLSMTLSNPAAPTGSVRKVVHPNNAYLQIINEQLKDYTFYESITKSFNGWIPGMNEYLKVVLKNSKSPEICYSCVSFEIPD